MAITHGWFDRRHGTAMVAAGVCCLGSGQVADADAHPPNWYWTESLAASGLKAKYAGVDAAYCQGRRKSIRTRSGKRGYKHHRCTVIFDDGTFDGGVFHVTGRYTFVFAWDR